MDEAYCGEYAEPMNDEPHEVHPPFGVCVACNGYTKTKYHGHFLCFICYRDRYEAVSSAYRRLGIDISAAEKEG